MTDSRLFTRDRFSVQTGTIPDGVTASGSKYPINSANVSIDNPNFPFGPTLTPIIPLVYLTQGFDIGLSGDWGGKIKPGDPLSIIRGSIRGEYSVQSLVYNFSSGNTDIQLTTSQNVVHLLDPFIGTSGYNSPATDTYLSLSRKLESPNDTNLLVKSFTTKMIATSNPDIFSLQATWSLDSKAAGVRLRWRSVPRNTNISQLSFAVSATGTYSQIPAATVVSETGRLAQIRMTGVTSGGNILVNGVTVIQQGGNYLSAPTVQIDPTYQIGLTATQVAATLTLSNLGRVDYIRVVNGGSGYTGASVSILGGSPDATAVAEISKGVITNIRLTSRGEGYSSSPIVNITPTGTGGTGAVAIANLDIYSEWVYTDSYLNGILDTTLTGFKYNVPYEIEILASEDANFRGLSRYSNTLYFQFYK